MSKQYPLNVPAPHHFTYAVRDLPEVTVEQRERALQATHYNEFAFPSGMLTVDMLSDSGTTAMTNHQWASLFLGDEAYGRNTGYYVLLDTFRDIFERGGEKNWKKIIDLVRTDCRDVEKMMDEVYLCEYEGGLFNIVHYPEYLGSQSGYAYQHKEKAPTDHNTFLQSNKCFIYSYHTSNTCSCQEELVKKRRIPCPFFKRAGDL